MVLDSVTRLQDSINSISKNVGPLGKRLYLSFWVALTSNMKVAAMNQLRGIQLTWHSILGLNLKLLKKPEIRPWVLLGSLVSIADVGTQNPGTFTSLFMKSEIGFS